MSKKIGLGLGLLILFLTSLHSFSDTVSDWKTLQPGKLIVATYFSNPPFEFLNHGKQVGFEVDLIKALAKHLGLQVEFKSTQWETIINELKEGRYDLIMGAITITAARKKVLAYSNPYMTTTLSILINRQKNPKMDSLKNLKHRIIGVQAATTDFEVAKKMKTLGRIADIKVYSFKEFNTAVLDLLAGRIDALMKVSPVAQYYVGQHPNLAVLAIVPNDPQPLGFAVNKNNPKLLRAINQAQAVLKSNGTYEKIYNHWFSTTTT